MNNRSRRVLFVSYLFPPTGGVGVHRVTKFVKYLPQYGWQSSVLTVSNPSVPLQDESLLSDIPAGTIIRRAKTYEPDYAVKNAVSASTSAGRRGNLLMRLAKSSARNLANLVLQPDSQVLWHPHALAAGLSLLDDVPHDAIVASGPPFSSLLLGAKLAQRTGVPLVLDYRDEWDISNAYWENKRQGRFANWVQSRQQDRALCAASHLLATTPSSTLAVASAAERAGSPAQATCIYNGFDPDDFPAVSHEAPSVVPTRSARFRLAFIGTLWNLNSIEPVVAALKLLAERNPHVAEEIELVLAGRRTDEQEAILQRLEGTAVRVVRLPFVSHKEAVSLMQSADSLLMLNSDRPQAQRIINAKTFEYMAARRPMFVVAPRGDVWELVKDLPGTILCEPKDVASIAEKLALAVEQRRCGIDYNDSKWDVGRFERQRLTGELAEVLDQLVLTRTQPSERGARRSEDMEQIP